jgi:hypothetical protein
VRDLMTGKLVSPKGGFFNRRDEGAAGHRAVDIRKDRRDAPSHTGVDVRTFRASLSI